jgi:hypothetical protein
LGWLTLIVIVVVVAGYKMWVNRGYLYSVGALMEKRLGFYNGFWHKRLVKMINSSFSHERR